MKKERETGVKVLNSKTPEQEMENVMRVLGIPNNGKVQTNWFE